LYIRAIKKGMSYRKAMLSELKYRNKETEVLGSPSMSRRIILK
jgi:hypothetical protein